MAQARLFLCALQFMTRLPTPRLTGFQPDWIARSAPYFPVVGWVVGAISATAFLAASQFWPGLPAAIIAIVAGLLVTGGFHEDGLADTADGLGGGQTPARRLDIMKDSRIGSYGVLALWSVLTLKAVLLATMSPWQGALALVLIHGAGRAAASVVMASLAYVRAPDEAKLGPSPMAVRPYEAAIAVVLGVAPMILWPSPAQAAAGLVLATIGAVGLALLSRRLIGGSTGDVLGGVEQLAELGLLLGFAAKAFAG